MWQRKEDEFTFDLRNTLEDHKYSINQLEVSPCGTKIISCSMDGVIMFWDSEVFNDIHFWKPLLHANEFEIVLDGFVS